MPPTNTPCHHWENRNGGFRLTEVIRHWPTGSASPGGSDKSPRKVEQGHIQPPFTPIHPPGGGNTSLMFTASHLTSLMNRWISILHKPHRREVPGTRVDLLPVGAPPSNAGGASPISSFLLLHWLHPARPSYFFSPTLNVLPISD